MADWLLGVLFRPVVTQTRYIIEEAEREPAEARTSGVKELDGGRDAPPRPSPLEERAD